MSEKKRFILAEDSNGLYSIFDTEDKEDEPLIYGARFGTEKIVDLLNKQQATIIELERKLKKYAKIGEEQLKQITDLQDELNECRARPTDERGVVKVEYR